MAKPPVAEEPRQHRQSTCRKVRLMNGSCRSSASTAEQLGNGSSPRSGVDDLGVQLTDGAKPIRFAPVSCVQWLAKHILPAGRVVSEIEPISDPG